MPFEAIREATLLGINAFDYRWLGRGARLGVLDLVEEADRPICRLGNRGVGYRDIRLVLCVDRYF